MYVRREAPALTFLLVEMHLEYCDAYFTSHIVVCHQERIGGSVHYKVKKFCMASVLFIMFNTIA